ncbi:MAG: hypothetical protein J1F28_10470 [Oscillospiraceae bacterium]|nr:hypothetical protein [Oscillospiraceae bacterium]
MSVKVKIGLIIGAVMVTVAFFFTIVSGISELYASPADPDRAMTGEVIEYRVLYAKEIVEIKHMLFGVIPIYSERFYITTNEDGANSLAVRADEKWFEENFTPDGLAIAPVQISALIKSASSKRGLNLVSVNEKLGDSVRVDTGQYADAEYISEATLKIISGILLVMAVITCIVMIILVSNGIMRKNGAGVYAMSIAAIIQLAAFIIILLAI